MQDFSQRSVVIQFTLLLSRHKLWMVFSLLECWLHLLTMSSGYVISYSGHLVETVVSLLK